MSSSELVRFDKDVQTALVATVKDLMDNLGQPLLEVLVAPKGTDLEISGLSIHDPQEPLEEVPGQLVVGVGLTPGREASSLLTTLAEAGTAALIVKHGPGSERLAEEAEAAGLNLLAVPPGTAWAQLILLISSVVSRLSFGTSGERLAGAPAGDLFAVANVVAELVDAPVTIEDPQSRVIAFSARQGEADFARAETVLGRQVPSPWLKKLNEQGVFQRLARERGPVYVDSLGKDVMPRVAIAVRAGDELLGSIWAAVPSPLSEDREADLIEAANFVALHLLRHRLAQDAQSGLEAELVGTVLQGGPLAADAAQRLSLSGEAYRVVAVAFRSRDGDQEHALARLRDLIGLHLSSPARRVPSAAAGGVVYAVVPCAAKPDRSLADVRQAAERLQERAASRLKLDVLVGIGVSAASVGGVPESRESADQVLRVLRTYGGKSVAELGDVRSSALLLRFADACADDPALKSGPIGRLRRHDLDRKTSYIPTLRAYLDSFGDAEEAARRLEVHPNTVRYRLRQLQSVLGVDLADPAERLVLMLELQLAVTA